MKLNHCLFRCSERFIDKRSACLLSSYLAGNDFYVLPNDFAIQKPSSKNVAVSDLDVSLFYRATCKALTLFVV